MLVGADECLVVEADNINHERVAIPVPNGIPHVRWVQIVRMSCAVSGNYAKDVIRLVKNDDETRLLNNLQRIRLHRRRRYAGRHARHSLAQIIGVGDNFVLLRARLQRDVVHGPEAETGDVNSGEIGMAVRGARNGLIVRIAASSRSFRASRSGAGDRNRDGLRVRPGAALGGKRISGCHLW